MWFRGRKTTPGDQRDVVERAQIREAQTAEQTRLAATDRRIERLRQRVNAVAR